MVRGRGRSTAMSATTRPGRGDRTTTRSATRIASGMLWVTITIVVAGAFPEAQQLQVEPLAGQGVERAERLVEQQDLGLEGQRPGERHPLARPARQLGRPGGRRPPDRGRPARSARPAAPRRRSVGQPGELERIGDVVGGRAPGQQPRLLEDEPDPRVRPGDRRAVEERLAARRARAARR